MTGVVGRDAAVHDGPQGPRQRPPSVSLTSSKAAAIGGEMEPDPFVQHGGR